MIYLQKTGVGNDHAWNRFNISDTKPAAEERHTLGTEETIFHHGFGSF